MKKKSILFIAGLASLLLVGCSQQGDNKPEFLINLLSLSGSNQEVYITKPGRVSGKQDIVVSSQVAGRIKSINKKDGDIVSGDQLVIEVADTIANYGLQVQRAKSAISRASLQSRQTQISLDKSINDVSLALDLAKNSYNVTQQSTEQSLKQAKLGLTNADSQSQSLALQFPIEKNNLLNLMDSVLTQVDTYLGVTDKYKHYNDAYEIYLGAKNTSTKTQAENLIYGVYSFKDKVSALSSDAKDSKVIADGVDVIGQGYDKTKQLLDAMRDVLVNTVSSTDLPQTTIDGYRSTIDGMRSSLQIAQTTFVAYRKQVISLISQGSGGSLFEVNQTQAQISYDTTRISTNNALFSTEAGVKSAETNYDSLLKNKNIQIGMANNAVFEANLSYQDALSRYENLFVKAPIPGVLGNILVDVGQEVAPGVPLFTLSSKNQQTIEMYVSAEERGYIDQKHPAKVIYDGQEFTGTILSVASVADKNFLYKVVVAFDNSVSILGDVASVKLPVSLPYSVLPINVVTPITKNKGFVWLYDGTGIQRQQVVFGRVWESYIEILSGLNDHMNIISNDVSYFDPTKFSLKIK